MEADDESLGFGGSCHWCTEAIFQALRGVERVDQGWIAPADEPEAFSEAVRVRFRPTDISLEALVAVHLATHACTSTHRFRAKYRSAVYVWQPGQARRAAAAIATRQEQFDEPIVTRVRDFGAFRPGQARYLDYHRTRPEAPFCQAHIAPKLAQLRREFPELTRAEVKS